MLSQLHSNTGTSGQKCGISVTLQRLTERLQQALISEVLSKIDVNMQPLEIEKTCLISVHTAITEGAKDTIKVLTCKGVSVILLASFSTVRLPDDAPSPSMLQEILRSATFLS